MPEAFFELVAASRNPILYRLKIAVDVAAWLDHGACFRLAGTSELASRYLAVTPHQQAVLLQSYLDLLRVINILFSAGGLLGVLLFLLSPGYFGSDCWQIRTTRSKIPICVCNDAPGQGRI